MLKAFLFPFLFVIPACDLSALHGIDVADDVYKVYNQDKAMLLAEARFEDRFGLSSNAFREARVFWTNTPCPYQDGWAVVHENRCYYGMMWGCDEIFVAMNRHDPNHTCHTVLLHEFGHCLLMEAGLNHDGDHSDEQFWDFIGEVTDESCGRGW